MKYPEWAPSILVKRHKNGGSKRLPPAELDTLAEKCHVDVTDIESIHYYERYYRRFILGINSKQINTLLGKFLTDIRMKNVWKSLTRRADKELDFYFFFASCEDGITGWQDDLKHSTAEQKAFYQEIHDTVLINISEKATQYGEEKPTVKKPKSENADIHYFVRSLSRYLRNRYNQPLHDVVAVTTEVTFDRQSIDSDYVRKLVG